MSEGRSPDWLLSAAACRRRSGGGVCGRRICGEADLAGDLEDQELRRLTVGSLALRDLHALGERAQRARPRYLHLVHQLLSGALDQRTNPHVERAVAVLDRDAEAPVRKVHLL